MTYADLLHRLKDEIREERAWPGSPTADQLADQLQIVYGAVLAVMREMPSAVFISLTGLQETDQEQNLFNELRRFALPANRFSIRPDQGLLFIELGDSPFSTQRFTPFQSISHRGVQEAAGNPWQSNNPLFHLNLESAHITVVNTDVYTLHYIALPAAPTPENYDDPEQLPFPLPQPYDRQVVQLAATHVEAVRTGDRAKSAVHKALADVYSGFTTPEPQAEQV